MSGWARVQAKDFAVLIGGLALGAAVAFAIGSWRSQGDGDAVFFEPDDRVIDLTSGEVAPGASSPEEAADEFLQALVDEDFSTSYRLLAASDRRVIVNSSWQNRVLTQFGDVTGFELPDISGDGGTATAATELTADPSLKSRFGLTAPRTAVDLALVDEDGWRVDLAATSIEPQYFALADDDTTIIAAAAREWLASGAACEPDEIAESADAAFRGSNSDLVGGLCLVPTASDIGEVSTLKASDAANGLATDFGIEIRTWARVAPTNEPLPARLVLAPVGDQWVVIDVLEAA